jgi:tetratricopeptide (TPR) repeat protein
MGGSIRAGWVVCVLLSASAYAQDQGDLETARRHFALGARRYDAGDYRNALDEFLTAQRLYPVAAFDFNIGRCYEQLGETRLAVDHYRRYVATQPEDAPAVQARILALEARLRPEPPPPPERPRPRRRTLAIVLGVVGGALVVGTAVTLGVTLGRPPDFTSSTLGPMRVTP